MYLETIKKLFPEYINDGSSSLLFKVMTPEGVSWDNKKVGQEKTQNPEDKKEKVGGSLGL